MNIKNIAVLFALTAVLGLSSAHAETIVCDIANSDAASGTSTMTLMGSGTSYSMKMPLDFSRAEADGSTFTLSTKPHVVAVHGSDDRSTKTFEFKYKVRQHRPGMPLTIATGDWYLVLDNAHPADSSIHRTYSVRIAFPTCIGYWQCQTFRQITNPTSARCSVSPDGRSGD